jgi:dTDP-4-dehydrorhamnose 3,5-epimerase
LTDHAEVFYQMTGFHTVALSRGVRWNDPAFGIVWPIPSPVLSEHDARLPVFAS